MRRNVLLSTTLLCSAVIGTGINAEGKSVEELKKAGDFRGLVAKLRDHRAVVRREAAVALPGVVEEVKDPAALSPIIGRLIDVRLRDSWKTTREYTGRALMNALQRTKNQVVLNNAVQPLVDALDRGQVDLERRRYAAVALSVVVMRLERVDLLRPRIHDLLAATFEDPDEGVRTYAERALQHTLLKLDHEPTLTIAAGPLAARLESDDLHFRSYSAVMLSVVVRKINDRDTLRSLLGRITPAATKDPDPGVRDYAGRAMHHIQHVLKEEKRSAIPAAGASGTKAGNLPADARDAAPGNKERSHKSADWRGLVAKLKDKNPEVRRQAAFALQRVVQDLKNDTEVRQLLPPLVAATLNDSDADVHRHARFALRHLLGKVKDETALIPVAQSFLAGLSHKNPQVRAHCAHDLPAVVSKVTDKAALTRMLAPLTTATLRSESMHAPTFPGFALRDILSRIDDPKALVPTMNLLVGGLQHKDQTMRGFCIHELSGIVSKIEDERLLRSTIGPLSAATLKAESMDARDFAGFSLRSVLRKTADEAAIVPIIQLSLAGLKHKDSTMRTFYAHILHENVSKVEDKTVLMQAVGPLTAASLQVTDSSQRGLGAAGLAYSALKQVLDRVDDQATLRSIVHPMAEALKAEEVKRRRYAAHAVMLFAYKVKEKAALWPLVQPLVAAHYHDPDDTVRRSAGLALERTFGRMPEPH